ncbi:MAG: DUF6159 family protein, partial [Planctomycetota bacterium]|nr:DUF6159 family protein [Planctomycetota bacterium]
KQSYGVLMKDKELMLLPLLSTLAMLVVAASFFFGLGLHDDGAWSDDDPVIKVGGFAFYLVTYAVGIFFQAAVIAGASERLSGGDPTLGSSIAAAARRLPAILAWSVVAATVGLVIRSVQERSELVGRIVMGLLGAVWSLAVFFMVPVLIMERESLPGSFKRSWALFKQTWGEMFVGNIGFGLLGFLLALPILAVALLLFLATDLAWVAIVFGVLGVGVLSLFLSTLQGVWVASLYRYATAGEVPDGFDQDLLQAAFRRK